MEPRRSALAGVILAASPIPIAIAHSVGGAAFPRDAQTVAAAAAAVICLAGAGLSLARRLALARILTVAALAAVLYLLFPAMRESPPLTLFVLIVAAATVGSLWGSARYLRSRQPERVARARSAAVTAVIVWVVGSIAGWDHTDPGRAAMALSFAISLTVTVRWAWRDRWAARRWTALLTVGAIVALATFAAVSGHWQGSLAIAAALSLATSFALPQPAPGSLGIAEWWELVLARPERVLVSTFLILCLFGTLLLSFPSSTTSPGPIGLVDAVFTAVSAVCVTGLVVLDTHGGFTGLGQAAILLLIQLGGLGIMTFAAATFHLLGRRMSLRQEGTAARIMSSEDRSQLFSVTLRLIRFTFAAEAIGAVCLVPSFLAAGDSTGAAVWRAAFTSVSAFCNAGFALQSDSLIGYQHNAWVLDVVATLIVIGGISPLAVFAVPRLIRRRGAKVALGAKIALVSAATLLALGFAGILASEWSNTLAGMSVWDRLHNAWFQSVTTRTAGFNSVDIAALQPSTISLMIVLMFIGGGPGGTAGGIKTTTVTVLLLALVASIRGHWVATAFGRSISHRTVYKAGAIATLGILSAFLGVLALQLTQAMPPEEAFFEVVSALGTVGLSTGGTALLDGVGKVIIIVCMFCGRVGPLTLFMFLTERQASLEWERPEEEMEVG